MLKFLAIFAAVSVALSLNHPARASTEKDAKEIYYKLVVVSGLRAPAIYIINDKDPNAYSNYTGVLVTKGMLSVANRGELALVLGHELGHLANHDNSSNVSAEYAADLYGARLISKLGYNVCSAAKLFVKLNYPKSRTHPSDMDRYYRLGCR